MCKIFKVLYATFSIQIFEKYEIKGFAKNLPIKCSYPLIILLSFYLTTNFTLPSLGNFNRRCLIFRTIITITIFSFASEREFQSQIVRYSAKNISFFPDDVGLNDRPILLKNQSPRESNQSCKAERQICN